MKTEAIIDALDCLEFSGTGAPSPKIRIETAQEARAELAALKAENAWLRSLAIHSEDEGTSYYYRDQCAFLEVENARMRETLEFFGDHEAVARHLNRLGWRPPLDAQWTNLKAWCDEIAALLPLTHNAPDVSGQSQVSTPADCKEGS